MEIKEEIKIFANKLRNELILNYYRNVHGQILPLEKLRIKLLFIAIILNTILFALLYYYLIYNNTVKILFSERQYVPLILLLAIVPSIIILPIKGFSTYYKNKLKKFYPQIFNIINLNYYSYAELHGIDSRISNSKLFPSANQSEEEDIFRGEYEGVGISIAETKIIDSGYTQGNTTEKKSPTTLFKGIIIALKSNKNIKSTTLIKPKYDFLFLKKLPLYFLLMLPFILLGLIIMEENIRDFLHSNNSIFYYLPTILIGFIFFAFFSWWFIESTILRELRHKIDLQKVNLEDVNFSKHYNAYSYDQVEARYLVTTAFIERFMYLEKVFKTKNIRCSFVDRYLVIAIGSNKDNFEIGGLFTSLNNQKHIFKFIEQIVAILLIVDYLKLNQKTSL